MAELHDICDISNIKECLQTLLKIGKVSYGGIGGATSSTHASMGCEPMDPKDTFRVPVFYLCELRVDLSAGYHISSSAVFFLVYEYIFSFL